MVPCAQGRVVVETARPAPPHFATCSSYRRALMDREDPSQLALGAIIGPLGRGALSKAMFNQHHYHRQQSSSSAAAPESPATRPEDLGVTPWYLERFGSESPGACDRSSYPSSLGYRQAAAAAAARHDLYSTRNSSVESSDLSRAPTAVSTAPRKAYMDLTDAMALLDETCPNQEASPSLTPRTPRTPLTPFPRSRRTRSKSSDNSSNYSNERLSEQQQRPLETSKSQDKEKRRPFLRKIGISMTEDRPFLAKIMAPRITGKPYLEKIGPSKAVEKPFLEKIGSSKTLDKFTFETLRELPRAVGRRCQPMEPSPLTIERPRTQEEDKQQEEEEEEEDEDVIVIVKEAAEEEKEIAALESSGVFRTGSRRANGKGYLLKMYSFETEDLNEETAALKARKDPMRGASLDDVLDSGPASLPPSEDSHEHVSPRSDDRSTSVAELVTCRVTTSDEIFSTSAGHLSSPREVTSWGNSPRWPRRRSRRVVSTPRDRAEDNREDVGSMQVLPSDESTASSPTKRRISRVSPDDSRERVVVSRTKNSSLPRDLGTSPTKARRQDSEEMRDDGVKSKREEDSEELADDSGIRGREELEKNHQREKLSETSGFDGKTEAPDSKSRRQNFDEALEKFGGSEHARTRTRRQVSEEILDRNKENKKNGECGLFDDPQSRFERRGISSDNLKLSRETVAVASMPSASSLGYQSGGDSSLVSQRSSNHSQDFVRGTFRLLHDKFELQDVPVESYAAFKRRTRANYHNHSQHPLLHHQALVSGSEKITAPGNYCEVDGQETTASLTSSLTTASTDSRDSKEFATRSASEENTESKSSVTVKSVLRKQEGVDHQSDNEMDATSCSLRRPKRRIIHEPSQETMDLLTELRKVKSLLKTPSAEGDDLDLDLTRTVRQPKKILLTDREFCLSVERENSIRRPSILDIERDSQLVGKQDQKQKTPTDNHNAGKEQNTTRTVGPALFEKRCLSLDYADDEKPPKPEPRAISLASARTPRSGTEDTIGSSDLGLAYDAKSYSSDVFVEPSEDMEDNQRAKELSSEDLSETKINMNNHCADVDIAIPVDQMGSISPKRRIHVQGRTSDLYEIISPRSTPFRVKKRLGRISVEETVKQESFTLSKVDCRSVVTQKRTKCFPL